MYFNTQECGARIRKLRKAHLMTQLQLAIQLNITDSNLCNIEKGKRTPSIDLLICMSELFQVSLDYLVLGRENRTKRERLLSETEAALEHIRKIYNALSY